MGEMTWWQKLASWWSGDRHKAEARNMTDQELVSRIHRGGYLAVPFYHSEAIARFTERAHKVSKP